MTVNRSAIKLSLASFSVTAILLVACCLISPQGARANPILDQSNPPSMGLGDYSSFQVAGRYRYMAQTFRVGISGTLTRIDFAAYHWYLEPLDWLLNHTNATGEPSPTSLAGGEAWQDPLWFDPEAFEFNSLDLAPYHIRVREGEVLAFHLGGYDPEGDYIQWIGSSTDQYLRGQGLVGEVRSPLDWPSVWEMDWPRYGPADLFFARFIEPIPEPSTLMLLGIGILGLIGYGWWTKTVR